MASTFFHIQLSSDFLCGLQPRNAYLSSDRGLNALICAEAIGLQSALFRWRRSSGQIQRAGGFAPPGRGARKQHEDGSPIMELLLIPIYVSICYVTFKLFRIPVNQWSLATATLGRIIGIALLLLIMNYNHPFNTNARTYFAVTPVFPSVRGRVIEVPVQANGPLKEGENAIFETRTGYQRGCANHKRLNDLRATT